MYPLPRIEESFTTMASVKQFSKLFLHTPISSLYWRKNHKADQITTHKDHSFVICSSYAFQPVMKNLLQGLEYVAAYLDDILITAKHLAILNKCLTD